MRAIAGDPRSAEGRCALCAAEQPTCRSFGRAHHGSPGPVELTEHLYCALCAPLGAVEALIGRRRFETLSGEERLS
jgi:hypothetical protein